MTDTEEHPGVPNAGAEDQEVTIAAEVIEDLLHLVEPNCSWSTAKALVRAGCRITLMACQVSRLTSRRRQSSQSRRQSRSRNGSPVHAHEGRAPMGVRPTPG